MARNCIRVALIPAESSAGLNCVLVFVGSVRENGAVSRYPFSGSASPRESQGVGIPSRNYVL